MSDGKKTRKEKIYVLLFGNDPGPERKEYLDAVRLIATLFVIGIHTVSLAASLVPAGSISYRILTVFVFSFVSCNLLFIMISGALLLPVKGEKAGTFYTKRFMKVAVPMVVYYILYVCAKEGLSCIYPKNLPALTCRILKGAPEEAPHFWLVYVILWLYVLTPFLRWLVHHIPDDVFFGVLIAVFLVNGLDTYAPLLGWNIDLSFLVDTYAGVFLLGYFLAEKCSGKTADFITVFGLISYLFTCTLILFTDHCEPYIYENAPTMMFFAASIFLLVKKAYGTNRNPHPYQKGGTGKRLFLRLISKYSYSILLIHWGVLHFAVKQILHVDVLSGGIIGGCILMGVLTLFLSAAGAVILDNTLIAVIMRGLHFIGKIMRKAVNKL